MAVVHCRCCRCDGGSYQPYCISLPRPLSQLGQFSTRVQSTLVLENSDGMAGVLNSHDITKLPKLSAVSTVRGRHGHMSEIKNVKLHNCKMLREIPF